MAPMYYRRANAALIVYDITREKSFDEAKEWVRGKQHSLLYSIVLSLSDHNGVTVLSLSLCVCAELESKVDTSLGRLCVCV